MLYRNCTAVRNEYCETPEDFVARRTRLAFQDTLACRQALPRVRSGARGGPAAEGWGIHSVGQPRRASRQQLS